MGTVFFTVQSLKLNRYIESKEESNLEMYYRGMVLVYDNGSTVLESGNVRKSVEE